MQQEIRGESLDERDADEISDVQMVDQIDTTDGVFEDILDAGDSDERLEKGNNKNQNPVGDDEDLAIFTA